MISSRVTWSCSNVVGRSLWRRWPRHARDGVFSRYSTMESIKHWSRDARPRHTGCSSFRSMSRSACIVRLVLPSATVPTPGSTRRSCTGPRASTCSCIPLPTSTTWLPSSSPRVIPTNSGILPTARPAAASLKTPSLGITILQEKKLRDLSCPTKWFKLLLELWHSLLACGFLFFVGLGCCVLCAVQQLRSTWQRWTV